MKNVFVIKIEENRWKIKIKKTYRIYKKTKIQVRISYWYKIIINKT